MPRNTNTTARRAVRITSLTGVRDWLDAEIERYTEEEEERLGKADEAKEQGQYIDAATFCGIAAKKKIVRQKLSKLKNMIAA